MLPWFVSERLDDGFMETDGWLPGEFTEVLWSILDCEKLRISESSVVKTFLGVEEWARMFWIYENWC